MQRWRWRSITQSASACHPVKLFAGREHSRNGGWSLRGQVLASMGCAPDQHLVHGSSASAAHHWRGITTGNTEDALPSNSRIHGQLCLLDACLSSSLPAPQSVESAGRQPSRVSRPHRNCLRLVKLRVTGLEIFPETADTLLWYRGPSESLFGLSNIVSSTCLYHRRLFVSLRNVNYAV